MTFLCHGWRAQASHAVQVHFVAAGGARKEAPKGTCKQLAKDLMIEMSARAPARVLLELSLWRFC